jgi:hypothetical protein
LNGNLAFGYTATTVPATQPILWGEVNVAECVLNPQCGTFAPYTQFPFLRVNFTAATDIVTAIVGYWPEEGGVIDGW